MKYSVEEVAKVIGLPINLWKGQCYGVATAMVEKDLVEGKLRYGHWLGPVSEKSSFAGKPLIHHGWIETKQGIVDPTRWVFEAVEPYIYFGKNDYYDAGGNVLKMENRRPVPKFNPNSGIVELDLDQDTRDFLYSLVGYEMITNEVCFWLANLPLPILEGYAKEIYQALEKVKMRGYIPIDNYRLAMNG